jgi:UPF0042 nucleotide-binding protein
MLKIRIFSFSFLRSGIPEDKTGNGGGFVFDCRFIENPGRKPDFFLKTGLDKEVMDFLDSNRDMQLFLENTSKIISAAVEDYIERDFSDLMISFGCTGGQHRSVYAAEKIKSYLEKQYKSRVKVELHHNDIPLS